MGKDMAPYNAKRNSVAAALTQKSETYLKVRSEEKKQGLISLRGNRNITQAQESTTGWD
jgi:hypothetical protein